MPKRKRLLIYVSYAPDLQTINTYHLTPIT